MGICSSSNSEHQVIEEINEHSDYEKARENHKAKNDDDIYEVKAKLFELIRVNSRLTRKCLISKYLFFSPNGKFVSTVFNSMSGDLLIEGKLNPKTFELNLITKQKLIENNSYRIRNYNGKLILNDKECIVNGKVIEDSLSMGKKKLENVSFELDFTTKLWNSKFSDIMNRHITTLSYIRYNDRNYSGICFDSKGLSLLKGNLIEDSSSNVILTKFYIDPNIEEQEGTTDITKRKETCKQIITGVCSNENKLINGTIKGKEIADNTPITLIFFGNPRKMIVKK